MAAVEELAMINDFGEYGSDDGSSVADGSGGGGGSGGRQGGRRQEEVVLSWSSPSTKAAGAGAKPAATSSGSRGNKREGGGLRRSWGLPRRLSGGNLKQLGAAAEQQEERHEGEEQQQQPPPPQTPLDIPVDWDLLLGMLQAVQATQASQAEALIDLRDAVADVRRNVLDVQQNVLDVQKNVLDVSDTLSASTTTGCTTGSSNDSSHRSVGGRWSASTATLAQQLQQQQHQHQQQPQPQSLSYQQPPESSEQVATISANNCRNEESPSSSRDNGSGLATILSGSNGSGSRSQSNSGEEKTTSIASSHNCGHEQESSRVLAPKSCAARPAKTADGGAASPANDEAGPKKEKRATTAVVPQQIKLLPDVDGSSSGGRGGKDAEKETIVDGSDNSSELGVIGVRSDGDCDKGNGEKEGQSQAAATASETVAGATTSGEETEGHEENEPGDEQLQQLTPPPPVRQASLIKIWDELDDIDAAADDIGSFSPSAPPLRRSRRRRSRRHSSSRRSRSRSGSGGGGEIGDARVAAAAASCGGLNSRRSGGDVPPKEEDRATPAKDPGVDRDVFGNKLNETTASATLALSKESKQEAKGRKANPPTKTAGNSSNQMRRHNRATGRQAIREMAAEKNYVKKLVPKTHRVKKLLRDAVGPNALFKACSGAELIDIIGAFEQAERPAGSTVIEQGEDGNDFYVLESGTLDVFVDGERVNVLSGPGVAFGELALLHGSPRTATVRAMDDCRIWSIHRRDFRGITSQYHYNLMKKKLDFLKKVEINDQILGKVLDPSEIDAIALATQKDSFRAGDIIVKEGERGDIFYMIESGNVDVYKEGCGDKPLVTLTSGSFFGERALLTATEGKRQATCVAASDVNCLFLMREDFNLMLGDLQKLLDRSQEPKRVINERKHGRKKPQEDIRVELADLEHKCTIGIGAFGRVKLVKLKSVHSTNNDTPNTYALKCLSKKYIAEHGLIDHVRRERDIMGDLHHPFILQFYREMEDEKCIYFLLEILLGGELFKALRTRQQFPEDWSQFYSASVLSAFSEMHSLKIAYRDLKPENLVMDALGYVKIIDFGLAKKIDSGKTWTFCGTPDYMPPEVILNEGHDWAVDYWALGVLIFEMTAGLPPFSSADPMAVYKKILSGHVNIPEEFSPELADLLQKLLISQQSKRLGRTKGGAEVVMQHKWYAGFDWEALLDKRHKVPILPKLKDMEDTSNFDEYCEDDGEFASNIDGCGEQRLSSTLHPGHALPQTNSTSVANQNECDIDSKDNGSTKQADNGSEEVKQPAPNAVSDQGQQLHRDKQAGTASLPKGQRLSLQSNFSDITLEAMSGPEESSHGVEIRANAETSVVKDDDVHNTCMPCDRSAGRPSDNRREQEGQVDPIKTRTCGDEQNDYHHRQHENLLGSSPRRQYNRYNRRESYALGKANRHHRKMLEILKQQHSSRQTVDSNESDDPIRATMMQLLERQSSRSLSIEGKDATANVLSCDIKSQTKMDLQPKEDDSSKPLVHVPFSRTTNFTDGRRRSSQFSFGIAAAVPTIVENSSGEDDSEHSGSWTENKERALTKEKTQVESAPANTGNATSNGIPKCHAAPRHTVIHQPNGSTPNNLDSFLKLQLLNLALASKSDKIEPCDSSDGGLLPFHQFSLLSVKPESLFSSDFSVKHNRTKLQSRGVRHLDPFFVKSADLIDRFPSVISKSQDESLGPEALSAFCFPDGLKIRLVPKCAIKGAKHLGWFGKEADSYQLHAFTDVSGELSHGIAITIREELFFAEDTSLHLVACLKLLRQRRRAAVLVIRCWRRHMIHRFIQSSTGGQGRRFSRRNSTDSRRTVERQSSMESMETAGSKTGRNFFRRRGSFETGSIATQGSIRGKLNRVGSVLSRSETFFQPSVGCKKDSSPSSNASSVTEAPSNIDEYASGSVDQVGDSVDAGRSTVSVAVMQQASAAFSEMVKAESLGEVCIVEKCYVLIGMRPEEQSLLFCALQQVVDLEREDNALKLRFARSKEAISCGRARRKSFTASADVENVRRACEHVRKEDTEFQSHRVTLLSENRHSIVTALQTKLRLSLEQSKQMALVSSHAHRKQQKFEVDLPISRFAKITLPLPLPQISGQWGFATLVLRIKSAALLNLLKLLLLERSILVIGDSFEDVTSCATALLNLLEPYKWASAFMPLLPQDMLDFVCSPVPFVAGMVTDSKERLHAIESDRRVREAMADGLSVLNLTSRKLHITKEDGVADMLHKCQNTISYQLMHHQAILEDLCKDKSSTLTSFKSFFQRGSSPEESATLHSMKHIIRGYLTSLSGNLSEQPNAWQQYGKFNETTNHFEFFPYKFVERLQSELQFQEMMAHTQLFVGFVEEKKNSYMDLRTDLLEGSQAVFIADWVFFRWRRLREKRGREYFEPWPMSM